MVDALIFARTGQRTFGTPCILIVDSPAVIEAVFYFVLGLHPLPPGDPGEGDGHSPAKINDFGFVCA